MNYLDANLPQRWIGRATGDNMSLTCWPPRSLDLTPCDFLLWGYVKDKDFVALVPVTLYDLKQRITTATAGVDEDMLTRVWQEFDYRVNICRVTKGAYIEHLKVAVTNFQSFSTKLCIVSVDILISLWFIKC
jgi:hypothetical protein